MATRLGSSLWPSEIEDLNTLLELLVHDGEDLLPFDKLNVLLRRIFHLSHTDRRLHRDEAVRRATSAVASPNISAASASRNSIGPRG
jgi:hypothetical protein